MAITIDRLTNIILVPLVDWTFVSGPLSVDTVLYNDVTDVNGQITFNLEYSADQPVFVRFRKDSSSPYYKSTNFDGVIQSDGLEQTVFLIIDE